MNKIIGFIIVIAIIGIVAYDHFMPRIKMHHDLKEIWETYEENRDYSRAKQSLAKVNPVESWNVVFKEYETFIRNHKFYGKLTYQIRYDTLKLATDNCIESGDISNLFLKLNKLKILFPTEFSSTIYPEIYNELEFFKENPVKDRDKLKEFIHQCDNDLLAQTTFMCYLNDFLESETQFEIIYGLAELIWFYDQSIEDEFGSYQYEVDLNNKFKAVFQSKPLKTRGKILNKAKRIIESYKRKYNYDIKEYFKSCIKKEKEISGSDKIVINTTNKEEFYKNKAILRNADPLQKITNKEISLILKLIKRNNDNMYVDSHMGLNTKGKIKNLSKLILNARYLILFEHRSKLLETGKYGDMLSRDYTVDRYINMIDTYIYDLAENGIIAKKTFYSKSPRALKDKEEFSTSKFSISGSKTLSHSVDENRIANWLNNYPI